MYYWDRQSLCKLPQKWSPNKFGLGCWGQTWNTILKSILCANGIYKTSLVTQECLDWQNLVSDTKFCTVQRSIEVLCQKLALPSSILVCSQLFQYVCYHIRISVWSTSRKLDEYNPCLKKYEMFYKINISVPIKIKLKIQSDINFCPLHAPSNQKLNSQLIITTVKGCKN